MSKVNGSPRLEALIASLAAHCDTRRGSKGELAAYLGVPPPRVSEWLSGTMPGGEYALGIQEWLAQERKRKV